MLGCLDGLILGWEEGKRDGSVLGILDGIKEGITLGRSDGEMEGRELGGSDASTLQQTVQDSGEKAYMMNSFLTNQPIAYLQRLAPSGVGQQSPVRPKIAQPRFAEHEADPAGLDGLDEGNVDGVAVGEPGDLEGALEAQQARKVTPSAVGQQSPASPKAAHSGFAEHAAGMELGGTVGATGVKVGTTGVTVGATGVKVGPVGVKKGKTGKVVGLGVGTTGAAVGDIGDAVGTLAELVEQQLRKVPPDVGQQLPVKPEH